MARNYDWMAPAELTFWPVDDGVVEPRLFPTLAEAIDAAREGRVERAWIVTQAGDILTPGRLADVLEQQEAPTPRACGPLGLFSWSRAA
ncbi:MAG: hypothetical protein JO048_00750 [Methylobacteriaceae bacterium]|nr:hypothetical protein [Methylobacteriaceae bacterium]